MNVLVIDIGGSHVKICATGQSQPRRFRSGKHMTPELLVKQVQAEARGWQYDVIAIGYPGTVEKDGPARDPANLAYGWVGYDFEKEMGRPVRIVNDAVLQALGGYDGGRMLFVGLGTGLGSALVAERVATPLELGCLPFNATTKARVTLPLAFIPRLLGRSCPLNFTFTPGVALLFSRPRGRWMICGRGPA